MLTRRRALAILGAAGIGTGVFQRAAKAAEGPVSPQMVADAEWVAGIKLTAAQLPRLRDDPKEGFVRLAVSLSELAAALLR